MFGTSTTRMTLSYFLLNIIVVFLFFVVVMGIFFVVKVVFCEIYLLIKFLIFKSWVLVGVLGELKLNWRRSKSYSESVWETFFSRIFLSVDWSKCVVVWLFFVCWWEFLFMFVVIWLFFLIEFFVMVVVCTMMRSSSVFCIFDIFSVASSVVWSMLLLFIWLLFLV